MSFNHNFIPPGGCCQWQPQLMALHAVSDLLIALAYYSIPAILTYYARKQGDVPLTKGFLLLGAWFFCGGTTHLMQVWMRVHPNYLLSSSIAAVTAIISLWAVASLIPWVSQMLALAGAASLPANTALGTEKVDRPQASSAIKNSVPVPTTELQQINQKLLAEITQRERVEELLFDTVDKLQESEERFRVFQELSLDGFNVLCSIRDESTIVDFEWEYVNPAGAKMQHRIPEELIGNRLLQVLPAHKDNSLFDCYVQVVETGIPLDTEIYYNSEGIVGWFRIMTVKLGDGIAISFSDITGRKQVEASLRNALQKLTSHFENTPLAVIEWDENFRVSGWSPAAQKIFGWEATEVLGKHFSEWDFISPGDFEEVESVISSLKSPRARCNVIRNSNYNKYGSLVQCEWYNSAFYSDSGQLISVLSLVLDVTERFNFMEVLGQSEERFRIAAESASDLIYEWDMQTDIVLWFGHIDEHLEYEKGEFPRTRAAWNSILHPTDRDRVLAAVDRYLSAPDSYAAPFFQEYRVQCQRGGSLHWIDRGKAVLDKQGNPCKWIGVISDISARKEAEEQRNRALAREQAARRQAEASELLYRVLAEAIPQIVWTARADGWFDYYNQRWFEYTGLTLEETQGWGWQLALHPDDVENCVESWKTSVETGRTYEVEYRFKRASDGAYRWHLGRALPVRDAEGKILKWFGTCTDIDDRQRSAQTAYFRAQALALLSSASLDYEEALQGLADLTVPGLGDWCCVHLIEADGSIRLQAVAHSDPTKVALLWQIDQRLPVDPQGRHGVAKVLRTGKSQLYPEIPDWVIEAVVPDKELLEVLRAQTPLSAICVPLMARGRTLGAISLLCGESGRRCGEEDLVLLEDLARDAAVAIDNARLYREAALANRIKDEFLATLSHELRTPLNAVVGWAQILRQRKLTPEKTAVGLETIERNARLQTQMIEDLLDVSRIVSGKVCLKLCPVDLGRIVETAVKALSPDAETRGIELASFYDEGVSLVNADATRLQQVVWNLLSNAIKFTPPSGRVEIRLWEDGEPGTAGGAMLSGPSPVHSVSIAVSDTGIGISKEFLPFVFDRFRQADSTSTRNYGGLGLGLAIVRHLVELHGGTVWAESPGEGLGSTFGVRLPITTVNS